jgi:hypothetical protein
MNNIEILSALPWLVPVGLLAIVAGVKYLLDFLFD